MQGRRLSYGSSVLAVARGHRSVLLTRNMISVQISQPSLTEYAILRLWISVLKKVSYSDCVVVQIMKPRRLFVVNGWLHKVRSVLSCRNLKIIPTLTTLRDIKNRLFPARKVSHGISNALLHPLSYVTLSYFPLIFCGGKLTYLYVE